MEETKTHTNAPVIDPATVTATPNGQAVPAEKENAANNIPQEKKDAAEENEEEVEEETDK